ncbi:MAG TPA: hypothetical protein VH913_04995 [Hyphomicrobiaceae bacterium]|jgi:hypothetical protein
MAHARSLDSTLHFEPRSVRGPFPGRSFFASLATYWQALRDGSAAAHDYQRLVRQGTPHAEAVARVFENHFDRR